MAILLGHTDSHIVRMAPIHEAIIHGEALTVDHLTKTNPTLLECRLEGYIGLGEAEGSTPLIIAARVENDHILHFLLENGANTNAVDNYQKTALWYVARSGNTTLIFLLINKGADVNLAVPLAVATMQGNDDAVGMLLHHGGAIVNARNEQGKTAIYQACAFGRTRLFKTLIEAGGDITICDYEGMTPLMAAAQQGLLSMMKLLMKYNGIRGEDRVQLNAKGE